MGPPLEEIRPNLKKAFSHYFLRFMVIISGVIVAVIYLHLTVNLKIILDTFSYLGLNISLFSFLFFFITIVVLLGIILFISIYIATSKNKYLLCEDKIICYQNLFVIELGEKIIPFNNISRILIEKKSILNPEKIIIELTGMKKNKIELKFIENPVEVANKINNLIRNYRAKCYAEYYQQQRIDNILRKV